MKTVFGIIKLACVLLIIAAFLDVAYYILLELDINFKGIQGWSHTILKHVDSWFGFIPDSWFKKQQVTWDLSGIYVVKNWWKADVAIFIFCGGTIWLIEFLENVFLEEEVVTESTDNTKKSELLNDTSSDIKTNLHTQNITNPTVNPELRILFKGKYFLFDGKTKLYINGLFHSKQSIKKGFDITVPIDNSKVNITLMHPKSTEIPLLLDTNHSYILEVYYDDDLDKFSDNYQLTSI